MFVCVCGGGGGGGVSDTLCRQIGSDAPSIQPCRHVQPKSQSLPTPLLISETDTALLDIANERTLIHSEHMSVMSLMYEG